MEPPDLGNARAVDNWGPLWRVAQALGGPWLKRAEAAYFAKERVTDEDGDSVGVMLLQDMLAVFDARRADRLASSVLVAALVELEDRPWSEWKHGRPMTANSLSKLMKPFELAPQKLRLGANTANGYRRDEVERVAVRYAPATAPGARTGTPEQVNFFNGLGDAQTGTGVAGVPGCDGRNRLKTIDCSGVPDPEGYEEGEL